MMLMSVQDENHEAAGPEREPQTQNIRSDSNAADNDCWILS